MGIVIYFLVSLFASVIGAICGIGGGVIIKPILDFVGLDSVSTISFLSGCTVLSMSCYSVSKSMLSGEKAVDLKTGTPLALGGAIGGIGGKQLFSFLQEMVSSADTVGSIQALCLAVITLGTLLYTIFKKKIPTHTIDSTAACVVIGLVLGVMSSFLGIGGGPINLVVLYFFFSMDTKTAAANSLYIILFSQLTSFLTTVATHSVPAFQITSLAAMVVGGIGGGMMGRKINKKLDSAAVEKLFIALMIVIIFVSLRNAYQYH